MLKQRFLRETKIFKARDNDEILQNDATSSKNITVTSFELKAKVTHAFAATTM